MRIVTIEKRYRIRDCIPRMLNFWIDVDPDRQEINIPATGPIDPMFAADLIQAIQYAIDLATGVVKLSLPSSLDKMTEDWQKEVLNLLRQDQKIQAIKLCRAATGLPLRDAKHYVEQHFVEQL